VTVLLVVAGAVVGAPTRWWVDRAIQRRWTPVFPWGTFIVNVSGSALLGLLAARWHSTSAVLALFGIGFCGSLTTFSSFAWESDQLAQSGARALALLNVLGTTAVCLVAAALGWIVGSLQ
jgi:CrcB protein